MQLKKQPQGSLHPVHGFQFVQKIAYLSNETEHMQDTHCGRMCVGSKNETIPS